MGNSGSDTSLATAGRAAAQGLTSFAVSRVSPDLGFSGMVLSASSDSVSMLLRALQESRRLEVLSRPQIMALDNQQGEAFVGERVPYITRSETDISGARFNTTELIDVGLSLQVTPRISPDGLVVMSVLALKSELGPISEGVPISIAPNGDAINAPRIKEIRAITTISAISGQTVVLSGLLTKRDRAIHRRVPILADVPLLGDLFRFDSVSSERKELLIILTPHVVRNRFEAERIKQIESSRMNWCLSDVIDLHGHAGLASNGDLLGEAGAETIYPEQVSAPIPEMAPPNAE
jgi:general secretion pathway protein D